MPHPNTIDPSPAPSGDTVGEWATDYNAALDSSPLVIGALTISGNSLTFARYNGVNDVVALPSGADRILSGLDVAITGTDPNYFVNTSAGQWMIDGTTYTLGATDVQAMTAPHVSLNRLDAVFADDNGDIIYTAGTPATNPVAPTPAAGQLLVAIISVPAGGPPIVGPPALPLPAGTLTGQTLVWNQSTPAWQVSNDLFADPSGSARMRSANTLGIFEAAQPSGTLGRARMTSANSSTLDGSTVFLNAADAQFYSTLDYTGSERLLLQLNGTSAFLGQSGGLANASLTLDFEEGIELTDYVNPPSVTTNKFYLENGVLKFNGNEFCFAPCGAAIPDGTSGGQTLRWDFVGSEWVLNDLLTSSDNGTNESQTLIQTLNGNAAINVEQVDALTTQVNIYSEDSSAIERTEIFTDPVSVDISYYPDYTSNPSELVRVKVGAGGGDGNIELTSNLPDDQVVIDTPNGLWLKDNGTPTTDTERLYNDGGVLYWGPNQVCTAPCGPETQNVNINTPGTTTLTPSGDPDRIMVTCQTTGILITVNLPATPTDNMEVVIKDFDGQAAISNITINGNGYNIDGGATATINNNYGSRTLIFTSGPSARWSLIGRF